MNITVRVQWVFMAALVCAATVVDAQEFSPFSAAPFQKLTDVSTPGLASADEGFGSSISLDGSRAIVGAPREGMGRVDVIEFENGGWTEIGQLIAQNSQDGDQFGYAVSLRGDLAVVSAPARRFVGQRAGSVYLFERQPGTGSWQQVQQIDGEPFDNFGAVVAQSDNWLLLTRRGIVEAYEWNALKSDWVFSHVLPNQLGSADALVLSEDALFVGISNAESVQVYRPDDVSGLWQVQQTLTTAASDGFGNSLALDGDQLLIGAPLEESRQGAAYLFEYDMTTDSWVEATRLADTDSATEGLGRSVALIGDTIAIGALGSFASADSGRVVVFSFDAAISDWSLSETLQANPLSSEGFGASLVLASAGLMVGATEHTGSIHWFESDVDDDWVWSQQLSPTVGAFGDRMARSVAAAGEFLLFGAPKASTTGAAHLFEFETSANRWNQAQRLEPIGEFIQTEFGRAVSLSGNRAAVSATGVGSDGLVYVFERGALNRQWSQTAVLDGTDAYTHRLDDFGATVVIDGDHLLIGAPATSLGLLINFAAGFVYHYQYDSTADQWQLRSRLEASDTASLDGFGSSIALDDTTALIGGGKAANPSSVYVFEFNDLSGTFEEQDKLVVDGVSDSSTTVAFQGNRAVVGVPDDENIFSGGSAFAFDRDPSGVWQQGQRLEFFGGRNFGLSVALAGDQVAIGDSTESVSSTSNAGIAEVFQLDQRSGQWLFLRRLSAPYPSVSDNFGSRIALSDKWLSIGMPGDDDRGAEAGAALVYSRQALDRLFSSGFEAD